MAKEIDFDRINANIKKMANDLPRRAARAMLNQSKEAFRAEAWTDGGTKPWASRKRPNKADRATGRKRALLVDSGNLKRSLNIKKKTLREIRVGSYGIPYASRHNQGLAGMPRRQFVGRSKELTHKLRLIVREEFRKVFEA